MAIQFSGLASGLDTDNIIKELMNAERLRVDKVEKEKTRLEWKKDVWEDMNKKLYEFYTKHVFDFKSKGTFSKKSTTTSDDNAISVSPTIDAPRGTHTIKVDKLAKGSFLTSGNVDETFKAISDGQVTLSVGSSSSNLDITKDDTVTEIVNKINALDMDVKASYDSTYDKIFLSTTKTGSDTTIKLSGIDAGDENTFLTNLGFTVASNEVVGSTGQDAEFTYNGASLTSADNEVSVNGLNIVLKQEAMVSDVTIIVTQDTDAIYDKVKDFITQYNVLIADINEKIGAESTRGYDPLTAEEKEAMSEDEVKLWEDKIKDSLLRRDSTLDSVLGSLRGILGSSSGVDTTGFEYNYLSDLGILTGEYTEKGLLHIDGDEDDPLYSAKTNKLRDAIENDPDKVAELLNAIGDKIYTTMQEKMKSTTLSSALTFFNDKQIDGQIEDYEDSIFELEERLAATEERYYKQFTAMEKAIQAMNSQSASLASMLGGGA